jgi:hypothetical protein
MLSPARPAIAEPVDHCVEDLAPRAAHHDDLDVVERCSHRQDAGPERDIPTRFTPHPDHEDVLTAAHISESRAAHVTGASPFSDFSWSGRSPKGAGEAAVTAT